jgi:transcription elongation factor Elf1
MTHQEFIHEIKRQCLEFEIEISDLNFANEVDFDKAYIRDDRLEKLKSLLEKKNIEVVSTKWIGVKDKYKFRCLTCGHEWEAQGTAFFNSRRTAGCDSCARSKAGESRLLGIENLDSFAKSFGGECLSEEYFGRKHKYEWRCKAGHVFLGDFNNMKFRNKFCPECDKA